MGALKQILFLVCCFWGVASLGISPLKNVMLNKENNTKFDLNDPFDTVDRFNYFLGENTNFSREFKFILQKEKLRDSCSASEGLAYLTEEQKNRGLQSFLESYRYLGLKKMTESIVSSAHSLEVSEDEFFDFVDNLIDGFCSQNITFISHSQFKIYFKNLFKIFNKKNSTTPSKAMSDNFPLIDIYKSDMSKGIRGFRNFCSWSGEIDNFEVLRRYIKYPSFIQIGLNNFFRDNQNSGEVIFCESNICRKKEDGLGYTFPLSIGSTSVEEDFKKIYCSYFFNDDLNSNDATTSQKKWMESESTRDSGHDLLYFLKISGQGEDQFSLSESKETFFSLLEYPVNIFFNNWAINLLNKSESKFYFEESFDFKFLPSSKLGDMEFVVGHGEFDDLSDDRGKIEYNFTFSLRRKFVSWWAREFYELAPNQSKKRKHLLKLLSMELHNEIAPVLKKYYFFNKYFSEINQLIFDQFIFLLVNYDGNEIRLSELTETKVTFYFGQFALKEIFVERNLENLTANKKKPYLKYDQKKVTK